MDLGSPSLDILCIHINELSHMGRLGNEVSHNAVNFYHCFQMLASQKIDLSGLHYNKFDQTIIRHSHLDAPPLQVKLGSFGRKG